MKTFVWTLVISLAVSFTLAGLAGCDMFGGNGGDLDDVPPERLVAMVAVYESGADPVHRLVVADFENPSKYEVLRKAGDEVSGTCFSPNKRRILFADQENTIVGTRARLKIYNLETDEVRDLDAPMAATHDGSLECTWRADGSGFYYRAAGAAGAAWPVYFDLKDQKVQTFPAAYMIYDRKGSDSLLVNMGPLYEGTSSFCFVDVKTKEMLECLNNEHLRFVPWKDESRGGWKQAAFRLTYSDHADWIAFIRSIEGEKSIAITGLEGKFLQTQSMYGVSRCLRWVNKRRVLFDHRPKFGSPWSAIRVMVWDTETDEVNELIAPEVIDGAVGLHLPDY